MMLSLCIENAQDLILIDFSKGDPAHRSYNHRILDGRDRRQHQLQPFLRDGEVTSLGAQEEEFL